MVIVRVGVAVVSAVVLGVSGVAWSTTHDALSGITISHALGSDAPRSRPGAMNILLIGLDSRKDQEGNDLPRAILNQLHAGDSDAGGYNTNTLILAHVDSANQVTAYSIPRDDYVVADGIPGYDHLKIKEAYGLAKADAEDTMVDQGVRDQATLESKGREAGRAATIRAVRDLTGQPVDYFAEVNLAGFYDLASAVGSVQVCLNHAVSDEYSGADFKAGEQTLNAAQALAFVRQRHGLDNGDLDRTHRQQAFLVSVMHQLQSSNPLADLSSFHALLTAVQKDVVLSAGWGEDQFARVREIAGGHVRFQTLPIVRYDTINGQDVNIVDPPSIRAEVAAAFSGIGPSATSPRKPTSTVEVLNAGEVTGLASSASQLLAQHGYRAGDVRNSIAGETTATTVAYGTGANDDATGVAAMLGIDAAPQADSGLNPGVVRVTLGRDYVLPATAGEPIGTTIQPAAESNSDDGLAQVSEVTGNGLPCVD